jgi:hypothetical protein
MSKLTELDGLLNERAEHKRRWKVREYHALLGSLPEEAEKERLALLEVGKRVIPLASELLRRYQVSELHPPKLHHLVEQLVKECRSALETLKNNPGFIEKKLSLIRGMRPEQLSGLSAATAAGLDRRDLVTVVGTVTGYRAFPKRMEALVKEIEAASLEAAERERQGVGHRLPDGVALTSRESEADGRVDSGYDPRLS